MARSASVTVSIAADSTGIERSTDVETLVRVSASSGSTRLSFGRRSTSSNVRASGTRSFSENGCGASFAM